MKLQTILREEVMKQRARIRNAESVKVITFVGEAERPGFCGLVCQLSWQNADLQQALRKMFAAKDNEVITAIEVSDDGIKAKFEQRV